MAAPGPKPDGVRTRVVRLRNHGARQAHSRRLRRSPLPRNDPDRQSRRLGVQSGNVDTQYVRRSPARHRASTEFPPLSYRAHRMPRNRRLNVSPPRCQAHYPGAISQAHRRIRDEYGKASSSRPFRQNNSDNEIMRCRCDCIEHASPHRAPSATARQATERHVHPLSARRPPAPVPEGARHRSHDDVRRPTGSSPASASGTNARGRSAHIRRAAALRQTACG